MTLYGIKTCGSVKKAMAFFKTRGIAYDFVDFKQTQVGRPKIESWLQKVPLDKLFNNKGTKYRTLGLSKAELSDSDKIEWLAKENMLIKRPVIECDDGSVLVAYDEEQYKHLFGA